MSGKRDEFWDIEKLVPKKKKTVYPFVTKPQVKEMVISGGSEIDNAERAIRQEFFSGSSEKTSHSYEPSNSLIKKVTLTRSIDKYDFYGNFRKAALIYFDMKAPKCDFTPFFSYMPQYSQLNSAQRNYYLYWREELKNSRFIKTDYSYIYLFVYEILNLPDKIPRDIGLDLLISVWKEYKNTFPNINTQMSLWIQDYCLMYQFPCPYDKLGEILFDAVTASEFKEFYLSDIASLSAEGTEVFLAYLSYYDWRRGRYAGGEGRDIYKKHLLGAMRLLLYDLWKTGKIASESLKTATVSRQSFKGSLCTHIVKAMLEIEYLPISHNEALRLTVTEALRYTENQLRALLGVKSRLAVKELDNEYKRIIDFYFDSLFEKLKSHRKEALKPEYEKLYDSEREKLSFADAEKIEKASWTSTVRLLDEEELSEAENDWESEHSETIFSHKEETIKAEPDNYGLSELDLEFLKAALNSDYVAMRKICNDIGELCEGIVERINEAFLSGFGDIVMDISGENAEVIEDYREELTEWLEKIMK